MNEQNPLNITTLVERAHRSFLEVVKTELEYLGAHDINNVQALILYNIGDAEMGVMDITSRGAYLGVNVHYNMNKLVESGYLVAERGRRDKRSVRVRASDKGHVLQAELGEMHARHAARLEQSGIGRPQLTALGETLRQIDEFWVKTRERSVSTLHAAE